MKVSLYIVFNENEDLFTLIQKFMKNPDMLVSH
jgi:hypothetical protein